MGGRIPSATFIPNAAFLTLAMVGLLFLAGCGTRASSSVELAPTAGAVESRPQKALTDIVITTEDITDRPYRVIGDIEVTVSKNTIFDSDPTPAKADQELRAEAAQLGADAVILVRYGDVGISLFSWGVLEARGRAVAYVE